MAEPAAAAAAAAVGASGTEEAGPGFERLNIPFVLDRLRRSSKRARSVSLLLVLVLLQKCVSLATVLLHFWKLVVLLMLRSIVCCAMDVICPEPSPKQRKSL